MKCSWCGATWDSGPCYSRRPSIAMTSTRSGDLGGDGARPWVGIAMVNWNGAQDVVSCFESLRRLRYQEFGVVLCDNASSDGSIDVLVKWASQVGWPTHVANHRSDGCEAEDRAIRRGDLKLVIVRNYDNAGFARGTNI